MAAGQSNPVDLRDITVLPETSTATIQLLVNGPVKTVVVEPKANGVAQIRMKSIAAGESALKSARIRPGVRSVEAHIERTDVLVVNVALERTVASMRVIKRDSSRIIVLVGLSGTAPAAASTTTSPSTAQDDNDGGSGVSNARRRRWSLSTIVIDAGHGGKDPGTIGIDSVMEKEITLAVAKKLREELEREMPGVNVVMTRETDDFVELDERGRLANRSGGRLFISIHCNSMPEKPNPKRGFECYILRPGRSADAARVAAAENDAIRFEAEQEKYDRKKEEMVIMANMAQNVFARYSEDAAKAIRESLRKSSGIPDGGIHQAGFLVLVGASMPAVLVELGYISNEKDKKALTNNWVQRKIAKSIAQGIKSYEKVYRQALD